MGGWGTYGEKRFRCLEQIHLFMIPFSPPCHIITLLNQTADEIFVKEINFKFTSVLIAFANFTRVRYIKEKSMNINSEINRNV